MVSQEGLEVKKLRDLFNERSHAVRIVSMSDHPRIEGDVIRVNDEAFKLSVSGIEGLHSLLKLPRRFQIPTELHDYNVNWLLEHNPGLVAEHQAITINGEVQGFKPLANPILPAVQVLDAILEGLGDSNPKIRAIDHSGNSFTVSVTTETARIEPKVGDFTEAGVQVHFSDVGMADTYVSPFATRLYCLNGSVHTIDKGRIPIYNRKAEEITRRLVESVGTCKQFITGVVGSQLNKSADVKVDSTQAVNKLCKELGLSHSYLSLVLSYLPQENDGTMYGVTQAFTRAANHGELKFWESNRLRQAAASILNKVETPRCASCYSVTSN